MNKKIIGIGILGMFLLASITALSAAVEDESVSAQVYVEQTTHTQTLWKARVYGYVTTILGEPIEEARVWIETYYSENPTCWCDYYENEYYTESDGFYEFHGVYNNDLFDSGHCVYNIDASKDGYRKVYPPLTLRYIYAYEGEVRIDFKLIKTGGIVGNFILEQVIQQNIQQIQGQNTPLSIPLSGDQTNNQ